MAKNRPPPAPTPGALLRAKRLENGWSQAEVAWALCLAERQMRALEADDYAKLPGRAYIVGYWQNYANLLGISIDHAIAAHKSSLPAQGARIALRAESRRAHGVLEQARRRWAVAAGALAVALLAALWGWRGADNGLLPSLADAEWRRWPGAVSEPATVAAPAPVWNGEGEADGGATVADASVLPEPNFAGEGDGEVDGAGDSDSGTVAVASTVTNNSTVTEAATSTTVTNDLTVTDDSTAPAQQTAGVTGGAAGVTGETDDATVTAPAQQTAGVAGETDDSTVTDPAAEPLTLTVRAPSWIEVSDAGRRELLNRNVAAGARVTLRGSPPFAVFIGNPSAVSVAYRGRPVAFAADGRFARFTVGAR